MNHNNQKDNTLGEFSLFGLSFSHNSNWDVNKTLEQQQIQIFKPVEK